MRLSEAIRLGAMIRPQAVGRAFRHGRSCALGAALEATGMAYNARRQRVDLDVTERWPWANDRHLKVRCPSCRTCFHTGAGDVIAHLNDTHLWTRDAIAEWVETIEPADVPAQASEDARAVDAVDPHVASLGTLSTRVEVDQ